MDGSCATTPLYYAALCGFSNLVEQLIVKHPDHVNALEGLFMTPAVAALAGRHFQLADVLRRNGSSVVPGRAGTGWTPLHCAAEHGDLEMVQVLLDYGVDINSHDGGVSSVTALYTVSVHRNDPRVVRWLLDHGADPNVQAQDDKSTPLHAALKTESVEVARVLIEYGASTEVKDSMGMTPLDYASGDQRDEIIKLLPERRTK